MKTSTTLFLKNRLLKLAAILPLMILMLAMLSGCERKGPAEEAGERIDETVEEIGEAIEDPGN